MIQPKIVVRNTISGRRPPAPERREKPRQRQQGTQGGDKREARAEERPLPPRAEASSAPTNHGVSPCPREPGGYATFYVSTQSFDDRDKPPAVSRGVNLPPPWGWVPPPPCGVPWGQGVTYSQN